MAFSEYVKIQAWKRANGRCEKCNKQLVWANHNEGERGAWEAHHKTSVAVGGQDVLSNCKILCLECHKNTVTYGRHR